jgi:hypothetical protein
MKARLNRLSLSGLGVALGAVLVSASAAWGQSSNSSIPPAMAGSILTIVLVFGLATYIYMALALQTIAVKTSTANADRGRAQDTSSRNSAFFSRVGGSCAHHVGAVPLHASP